MSTIKLWKVTVKYAVNVSETMFFHEEENAVSWMHEMFRTAFDAAVTEFRQVDCCETCHVETKVMRR